jgi:hypothetical protein
MAFVCGAGLDYMGFVFSSSLPQNALISIAF